MNHLDDWKLWRVNSVVYTIEDAHAVIDGKNNLISRSIPAKMRELRKMTGIVLERIETRGIDGAARSEIIKPVVSAKYPLYEVVIGKRTVWRMLSYKDGANSFIVILDVFESHQDKNKLLFRRSERDKPKYEIAVALAKKQFGGSR